MILSMSRQTALFFSTVCAGAAIGVIYDFFRIFRKTTPHKNAFVQIEDLIFWLAATLLMFYFMLHASFGEIRFFVIIGVSVGMLLYFATLSKLVIKIFVAVVNFMKQVVAAAFKIILLPVTLIIKLLTPPIKKCSYASRKHLHALRIYGKMKLRKTARHFHIIRKKV
jgi:spore cortex biosynthesis protein YabQ